MKINLKAVLLAGVLAVQAFAFTGCNKADNEETEQTTETAEESQTAGYVDDVAKYGIPQLEEPSEGDTIATIETNMGNITVRLFPEIAPKAVENFITHAKEGYYDGVIFHRVIDNFMIQGGDPEGTGMGGESIWGEPFENEVSPSLRHFRGALAMANAGADTNGSQFYIVQQKDIGDEYKTMFDEALEKQNDEIQEGTGVTFGQLYPTEVLNEYLNNGGSPYLDGGYTVFGQVTEGMDVVDAIAAVETGENDKPVNDVVIKTITVSEY